MSCLRPLVLSKPCMTFLSAIVRKHSITKQEISIGLLSQEQVVGCVQSSYLQAPERARTAIVVKIVDVGPSKRQRVGCSRTAKLLSLKIKPHRVYTGDPLGPRRMKESCKSSLFSSTCEPRICRRPVEAYGALLKREALDSYKIIYTSSSRLESLRGASPGFTPRTCQEDRRLVIGFLSCFHTRGLNTILNSVET
jgi:hypothetical protein